EGRRRLDDRRPREIGVPPKGSKQRGHDHSADGHPPGPAGRLELRRRLQARTRSADPSRRGRGRLSYLTWLCRALRSRHDDLSRIVAHVAANCELDAEGLAPALAPALAIGDARPVHGARRAARRSRLAGRIGRMGACSAAARQHVQPSSAGGARARAQAFAKKWNIPRATDRLDDLIQLGGVDLYVVGLPTFRHQDVCLRLAEAGRSLLCTKPLGRTAAEARTMLAAVRARGVRHGYLETEVFTPALVRVKELVDRGAIGEVVMVKSREAHFGSHSPYNWDPELAGGGPLLLLGSHNVEFSRFMLDKPRAVEVFAWTGTLVHQTPLEDTAVMLIRFDGGKMAQVEVNWITRHGLDLRN